MSDPKKTVLALAIGIFVGGLVIFAMWCDRQVSVASDTGRLTCIPLGFGPFPEESRVDYKLTLYDGSGRAIRAWRKVRYVQVSEGSIRFWETKGAPHIVQGSVVIEPAPPFPPPRVH